ncbi:MAG: type II secretion system major pseudopilin GspG [Phycisphaerales bacterium]|nr:type II secretion system major pseudopilin GspG [Phycisphaerales bacterium]
MTSDPHPHTVNPSSTPGRRRIRRRAFTILELLIVIAILLAIGGIVLINVLGAQDRADIGVTQVQMQALVDGMKQFRVDMKRYPSEDEGVAVLWSSSALDDEEASGSWGGPYLEKPVAKDQWGNPWVYRNPSETEGLPYDLVSNGPDGEEDNDDDISIHDDMMGEDGEMGDDFSDFASPSDGGG